MFALAERKVLMEWYQIMFARPGSTTWQTLGGSNRPYKFGTYDDALTGETETMKQYPGCAVIICKVTEVLYSDLVTHRIGRQTTYQGVLN